MILSWIWNRIISLLKNLLFSNTLLLSQTTLIYYLFTCVLALRTASYLLHVTWQKALCFSSEESTGSILRRTGIWSGFFNLSAMCSWLYLWLLGLSFHILQRRVHFIPMIQKKRVLSYKAYSNSENNLIGLKALFYGFPP